MSRYPLIDTGFTDAMMGGANLGLRAVALQDQQRQAQVQAELERQRLGIDQGNLDVRRSEQTFRQRQYDDEIRGQQQAADANTAALTGAAGLMEDAAGVNGPPMPPEMVTASVADLLRRTAAADVDVRRHLMGIGAQAQTQQRDDQQLAGFYQWLDGLEGAQDGVRKIKPHQAAYLRAQAPTLVGLKKDPFAAAAELEQEKRLGDMLKQQVGPDPILHAAIDSLAETPGGISKAPPSVFAGLLKQRQDQMKAEQDAAAKKAMIDRAADRLQQVNPRTSPETNRAIAGLRIEDDIPVDPNGNSGQQRDSLASDRRYQAMLRREEKAKRELDKFEQQNARVLRVRSSAAYAKIQKEHERLQREYDNAVGSTLGYLEDTAPPQSPPPNAGDVEAPTDHGNINPTAQPTEPPPQAAQPAQPPAASAGTQTTTVDPARRQAAIQQAFRELGRSAPAEAIRARVDALLGLVR